LLLIGFLVSIGISALIFIILFAFVLAELATRSFLSVFAAAPPHLTAPFRLMRTARPIIILLFEVLFTALFANLLVVFDAETPIFQFGNSLLHLVTLHLELLSLLYLSFKIFSGFFELCSKFLQIFFKLVDLFFHLSCELFLIFVKSSPACCHFLQILPGLISFISRNSQRPKQIILLTLNIVELLLNSIDLELEFVFKIL
jgi:hypothetical protein